MCVCVRISRNIRHSLISYRHLRFVGPPMYPEKCLVPRWPAYLRLDPSENQTQTELRVGWRDVPKAGVNGEVHGRTVHWTRWTRRASYVVPWSLIDASLRAVLSRASILRNVEEISICAARSTTDSRHRGWAIGLITSRLWTELGEMLLRCSSSGVVQYCEANGR